MEKVTIELTTKDHPELGPIGESVVKIAMRAIRSVYGNLDIVRGQSKVETYDTERSPE